MGTTAMGWGEAWRLTQLLLRDPGSWVGATVAGWEYPAERTTIVLMDIFDLVHQIAWKFAGGKGSAPKPYPRPMEIKNGRKPKPTLSYDERLAALRYAGHTLPAPA